MAGLERAPNYVVPQPDGDTWASLGYIATTLNIRHDSLRSLRVRDATFPSPKTSYNDGRGRLWSVRDVTAWYPRRPETRGSINHRDPSGRARKAWVTRKARYHA